MEFVTLNNELKCPVVGIGTFIENLDSSNVELTDDEFAALEEALSGLKVYGHRGLGEF